LLELHFNLEMVRFVGVSPHFLDRLFSLTEKVCIRDVGIHGYADNPRALIRLTDLNEWRTRRGNSSGIGLALNDGIETHRVPVEARFVFIARFLPPPVLLDMLVDQFLIRCALSVAGDLL